MSKWNKPNPQPLTQQFIQNEQRRKQMIIEAAKRRKQKQKKILEQQQIKKRDQQQALVRHKQQKKDAYIKYLRNNIYDKYEQAKRQKKQSSSQMKPISKWKKKSAEKQQNDHQLQALDLQIKIDKQIQSFQEISKKNQSHNIVINNSRKKLNDQFQKQWQFQVDIKDQLLSSKLLDSLDLDVGTLNRDYQMKQLIKEKKKNDVKEQKVQQIMQLRDLIGYQSIVITQNTKQNAQKQKILPKKNLPKKPEVDQVQVLNQLKHKKQAKVLVWAIQQQQDAEDLFSQCSSIARKKQPKALKELNEELKNKKIVNNNKKALQTIKQVAREKIASRQKKTNSIQAPKQTNKPEPIKNTRMNSKQKNIPKQQQIQSKSKSIQKKANTTTTSNPTFTKKQQPKREPAKTASGFSGQKNITRVNSTSQQKRITVPESKPNPKQTIHKQASKISVKPQQQKKTFGNLPPLPVQRVQNNSIATHDMQIDVQSFIKQDLINLNEQQMKLQQQLRILHKNNRNTLKQVYQKYEIKNDYGSSNEVTGDIINKQKQYKYNQNELDIQDSIQNLDNYLIRRDLQSKQKNKIIKQQTQQDINTNSLINPFSNSQQLCNQILQLAKNVSKFQNNKNNIDNNGYNYINKMKRNKSGNKISQISRITKNSKIQKQQQQFLSQSKDQISQYRQQPLHRPPFIFDASQLTSKGRNQQQKIQKIHVNTKLLKGLLLDDD